MWQDLLETVVTSIVGYITEAIFGPVIGWIMGLFGFAA